MFQKIKNNALKILLVGVLIGLGISFLPSHLVHAADGSACSIFNTSGCIGVLIGWIFYIIVYVVSFLAGIAIALEVWIITVLLAINAQVVNTPIVQTGFGVLLSVANLGFVVGIIIVALATILRQETYGVKSILWKLVFMAILVNFALVIAAPIIGFANTLTTIFLTKLPGGGNGFGGFNGFADSIASGFQPQRLIAPENATGVGSAFTAVANATGGTLGTILGTVVSLLSAAVFLVLIAITLGVFGFMLLIRYVYLTILLILAPMAWMLWIFPKTNKYMSQWWGEFIRWNFFAPIVMFFVWLSLGVGSQLTVLGSATTSATQTTGFFSFFQNIVGNTLQPIIESGVKDLVLIGLLIGGMYAANKMSITGASTAIGTFKGVQNYATKQGKKYGRVAAQKAGVGKAVKGLREGNLGQVVRDSNLKIPLPGGRNINLSKGFGRVADSGIGRAAGTIADKTGLTWAATRGGSIAGRRLQPLLSNKDILDAAKKGVPESTDQIKENLKGNMNFEDRVAHLEKLVEKGEVDKDTKVGNQTIGQFLDQNKEALGNYGAGKLTGDANKRLASDANLRESERITAANEAETKKAQEEGRQPVLQQAKVADEIKDEFGKVIYKVGDLVDAQELNNASLEKIIRGMSVEDAGKAASNSIFGPKTSPNEQNKQKELLGKIALYAPQLLKGFVKNMKSPALKNVKNIYEGAIDDVAQKDADLIEKKLDELVNDTTISPEEQERQLEVLRKELDELKDKKTHLESVKKTFKKVLATNVFGFADAESGDAPAATPTPPPAPH